MNYLHNLSIPLQSIFWSKENSLLKQSLLILFGVLILAIASQISIPLKPVPLTFQSTTVVLIGMIYGARNGTFVISAYLLAAFCGLPVLENFSAGAHELFGPTWGYSLGFLPAAFFSGYLAQKGFAKNIILSFVAAFLGDSIIFAFGIVGLAWFIGWEQAFLFGLMPFVISEPIKLIAVSYFVPRFWKKNSSGN